jgi:glycosyltransferase involved in cell wall biosynthesis
VNITAGGISGGYRKYLERVIPRIAAHRDTDRLLCAAPRTLGVRQWFDDSLDVEFMETGSLKTIDRGLSRELSTMLGRFKPDVVYVPVERYFRFEDVPVVHMLQNMEPLIRPFHDNPAKEKIKNFLRRVSARRALKNTDRVIAISAFVRDFIADKWNIPHGRIGLVYHGIDNGGADGTKMASLTGSHDPTAQRFIFTAGSIRPARGLEDLISALSHLQRNNRDSPNLVVAGTPDSATAGYGNYLDGLVKDTGLAGNVLWAGQLNEEQMKWYYKNCSAFVMTSRVESFGHTAGEALSHGCLCISADNPCLPEIFGDAALYYPSGNGEALASVIEKGLSLDWSDRGLLSQRARNRATSFSWDVCAKKTVEELKKAAGER